MSFAHAKMFLSQPTRRTAVPRHLLSSQDANPPDHRRDQGIDLAAPTPEDIGLQPTDNAEIKD